MPITVFRNYLDESEQEAYLALAKEMVELASKQPGMISFKRFTADDGERVTLVEFADFAAQQAWAALERHLLARWLGRQKFFKAYDIAVCDVVRRYVKTPDGQPTASGTGLTDVDPAQGLWPADATKT